MNFGQNLFNWALGNIQPIILLAILCVGVYLMIERKISKVVGLLILSVVAVGFVFDTNSVKDLFLEMFHSFFK